MNISGWRDPNGPKNNIGKVRFDEDSVEREV
jgi:hypothetical protein